MRLECGKSSKACIKILPLKWNSGGFIQDCEALARLSVSKPLDTAVRTTLRTLSPNPLVHEKSMSMSPIHGGAVKLESSAHFLDLVSWLRQIGRVASHPQLASPLIADSFSREALNKSVRPQLVEGLSS